VNSLQRLSKKTHSKLASLIESEHASALNAKAILKHSRSENLDDLGNLTLEEIESVLKTEVETKAKELIENVLKPKHVLPPPKEAQGNYIIDIGAKWYRAYFYFFTTYACPGPNALSPTFESKFARMEYLGDGKFALYFMRHTGEWVGTYDALSVDESMKAMQDDSWLVP